MLTALKNIFQKTTKESYDESNGDLNLLCGLMIEAAQIDGTIDQQEVNKISSALIDENRYSYTLNSLAKEKLGSNIFEI